MTLRDIWEVTDEPIYLDTGHGIILYIGSKILLENEKRKVEKIYSIFAGTGTCKIVIRLEENEEIEDD